MIHGGATERNSRRRGRERPAVLCCAQQQASDQAEKRMHLPKFTFACAAGHYTNQFFVLKDSPIQKVADLKGKVVATNAVGSAVDIAMRAMLRKHGLEDKRDYTVVEAPFPTMKAMLAQ